MTQNKAAWADLPLLQSYLASDGDDGQDSQLGTGLTKLLNDCLAEITNLRAIVSDYDTPPNVGYLARLALGTDFQSVRCPLTSIARTDDVLSARYEVVHSNGKTRLSQELTLTRVPCKGWSATIDLSDFPDCPTSADAVNKLAEWLLRLGLTLNAGVATEIKLEEL